MRHIKTSFFLSALYLLVEIGLAYLCFAAKAYPIGAFLAVLTFLELYRLNRKIHFLKNPLTREDLSHRKDLQQKANSYYWNQWYRFADSHEHEYIANKFHEQIKKINK